MVVAAYFKRQAVSKVGGCNGITRLDNANMKTVKRSEQHARSKNATALQGL